MVHKIFKTFEIYLKFTTSRTSYATILMLVRLVYLGT